MEIGEKIKQLRKSSGLTQQQLGEKIGVSAISIRKYESGDRIPSTTTLKVIADIFNVSLEELRSIKPLSNQEQTYINTKTNTTTHDLAYRKTMKDISDSEAYDALMKLQCYAYNRSKNYVGLNGKEYNELLSEVCKTINNHALNVLRDRGELIYSPKKEGE